MKHFGDITKLSGYTLPTVDVIAGGSPCQDLSVAGKRAGLGGERSGLFMEQIRIVKEMRERERAIGRSGFMVRPRYCVWENVPGAFSSNGGKDFQAVLTEFARIAEPGAPDVPLPEKGRWSKSGCIYSEMGEWSIAWRVHDAQFWGVPQRRKRIALVADFGGLSAPEILFEREGLSRDSEPGKAAGEEATGGAGSGAAYSIQGNTVDRAAKQNGSGISENVTHTPNAVDRHAVISFQNRAGKPGGGKGILIQHEHTGALSTVNNQSILCAGFDGSMGAKAGNIGYEQEKSPTLNAGKEMHVFDARGNGDGETVPTLTGDHQNRVMDYTALCVGNGQLNQMSMAEQANTLDTMHDQHAVMVLPFDTTQVTSDKSWSNPHYGDPCHPLAAQAHVPSIASPSVVRRLTPMECERLQGYPDGWTDIGDWTDSKGKKHKAADSPRYKALGNSIALPFWQYLARRICAQYERDISIGSLFDGIGGFPLVFERCGAKAVWASEIEEFPIAVTKKHFPE